MPEVLPFAVLLAKSGPTVSGEGVTVTDHCVEVADCAGAIVEVTGARLAAFFGLDDTDEARLGSLLRMAALMHDVGKAGGSFQHQMHEDTREVHPFRHEALSVAVGMKPDGLGSWMEQALPDTHDRAAVLTAVMGHHVRASPSAPEARTPRDEVVYLDHPSLSHLWQQLARCTGAETTPEPGRLSLRRAKWGGIFESRGWGSGRAKKESVSLLSPQQPTAPSARREKGYAHAGIYGS